MLNPGIKGEDLPYAEPLLSATEQEQVILWVNETISHKPKWLPIANGIFTHEVNDTDPASANCGRKLCLFMQPNASVYYMCIDHESLTLITDGWAHAKYAGRTYYQKKLPLMIVD